MGALRTILSGLLAIALAAPLAAAVTGTVAVSGGAENGGTVLSMLPRAASESAAVSFDTDAGTVGVSDQPNPFLLAQLAEATVGWASEGAPAGGASFTVDVTVDGETTSVTLP